ncbi:MAG: hypothetical protein RJA63_691 [Pseudomonadota bacterium]
MKPVVLVPLLAVISACGGGGGGTAEPAKPTIVECMTPKVGVMFETADRRAKLGPAQIDFYGPYDARYEVVADQFEGRPALSIRTYEANTAESGAVSWDFTYADAVVATSSGIQLLGREGSVDHPDGYRRIVYAPPVTTPAALTIGETALRQYAGTYTRTVAGAADEVRTFSLQDRIEWLGYEDIPVADGHTLQNVCKVRVSMGTQPLAYEWYAVGYGLVARGADVDGKLEMQQVPTRIEQAP